MIIMIPRLTYSTFALASALLAASFLSAPALAESTIRLATTTSTENSGLLKALLPQFERDTGYKVHVIAVGTGKALRMGRDGDVDVMLVHAPAAEHKFVADGHGVERRDVMYNDFVIVGPRSDPAGIRDIPDAAVAFARIAAQRAPFVSRGDDSGTHKKELALWDAAGVKPTGTWYREAGQGMEQILHMAGEFDGYTLTDRGTWLAIHKKLTLDLLVQGDVRLFNPYGVVAVNPARYPDTNHAGAMALINWLISPNGRSLIGKFKINGESLFVPMSVMASDTSDR